MINNINNPLNIIQTDLSVLGGHFFRYNILRPKSLVCVLCGSIAESVKHRVVGDDNSSL